MNTPERATNRVELADAAANFDELVERALAGEEFEIVSEGRVRARLTPPPSLIKPPPNAKPFDWDAVREMTDKMTPQTESAGEFFRKLRDSDRY